jgi:arsenate reductase (glutaredoxin)
MRNASRKPRPGAVGKYTLEGRTRSMSTWRELTVLHPVSARATPSNTVARRKLEKLPLPTPKAVTIYGIKNCDTMKKARAWLDSHDVAYAFHAYKAAGISHEQLASWARAVGWEALLNRAGTTFRKLPDADRDGLTENKAIALMLTQPAMIKRPVLDRGGALLVGFKPEPYAKAFRTGE